MNGQELGEAIADSVNSGIDPLEFQAAIDRSHNALQYNAFAQVFKPGIIALAGSTYVDRRNMSAVETCQEICDAMDWDYE